MLSRLHAREGVWERSAKSDKGDGSDGFLQATSAAKEGRKLADDRSHQTDESQRDQESEPAAPDLSWGNASEQHLPSDSPEVEQGFSCGHGVNVAILVNTGSQLTRNQELLAVAWLLLSDEVLYELLLLRFLIVIDRLAVGNDFDNADVLFRDLCSLLAIEDLDCEDKVVVFFFLLVSIFILLNHFLRLVEAFSFHGLPHFFLQVLCVLELGPHILDPFRDLDQVDFDDLFGLVLLEF